MSERVSERERVIEEKKKSKVLQIDFYGNKEKTPTK